MVDLDGHRPIDIEGNERPDLDTRVTQKPDGVADNEGDFDGYPAEEITDPSPEEFYGGFEGKYDDWVKDQVAFEATLDPSALALHRTLFVCSPNNFQRFCNVPGGEGNGLANGSTEGLKDATIDPADCKESSLACAIAIAIAGIFPWFKGLRWGDEAAGAAKSGDELPGLLPSAPKPLGLGSTGRTVPENLKEQMAMTAVRNNPAGSPVTRIKMGDSRWPGSDGWVKMQQIEGDVNIRYVYNTLTGSVDDFKFVSR